MEIKDIRSKAKEIAKGTGIIVIVLVAILLCRRFMQLGMQLAGIITLAAGCSVAALLGIFMSHRNLLDQKTIEWTQVLSVILMLVPIIISFIQIEGEESKQILFIHWTKEFSTSIRPTLISTALGITMIMAFLVRNNPRKLLNGVYPFILVTEDVLFAASFLNILCSKEPLPIPGITVTCQTALIIAAIISWIGIKAVAGFMWAAVAILSISRLASIDNAMGFGGSLYILCAFLSLLLQWKALDIRIDTKSLMHEFISPAVKEIRSDVNASMETTSAAAAQITGAAKTLKRK